MADKWFSLLCGGKNVTIWLEAEVLQPGVKNQTHTPCVSLSWLGVCSCSNELHHEFWQSQQKSINLRSGGPLNHLRAGNIGVKTLALPKPPGAITEPGGPQIDRLIWSPALVHKGMTHNVENSQSACPVRPSVWRFGAGVCLRVPGIKWVTVTFCLDG